ncbi:hypothetical protein ACFO4E_27500 [Nocardiopsis mangrovi]|uniref:Uncharacterized protein n=1 Tax=Nocardiopsis mangrovi TaxID=1179818 RepID=A0ABV9E385_9ACTN
MKRNVRSAVLTLVTSGLVVVGSVGCSAQGMLDAVMSADPAQPDASSGAESGTQNMTGELEFIAPGELAIDGQAFFVAADTQITGGIYACPADDGVDPDGNGTVECDLETLEATLQEGTVVIANVAVNDEGNAESITEYDANSDRDPSEPAGSEEPAEGGDEAAEGSGGFTGTATGELEYLAPGEYIVDGTAFYVAEDTQITAGIYACAGGVQDPDTGNVTCDFDEFDATLARERDRHPRLGRDRRRYRRVDHRVRGLIPSSPPGEGGRPRGPGSGPRGPSPRWLAHGAGVAAAIDAMGGAFTMHYTTVAVTAALTGAS